jgi:hypothetical protein
MLGQRNKMAIHASLKENPISSLNLVRIIMIFLQLCTATNPDHGQQYSELGRIVYPR